jgi:Domain of unknown function (DUF4351)
VWGVVVRVASPRRIDKQDLVRSLPIAQLESLGEALLDFTGMADLEAWLGASEQI